MTGSLLVVAQNWRKDKGRGRLPRGIRRLLGVMGKFITLVVEIVSQVYTFVKTNQIVYLSLLHISYSLN